MSDETVALVEALLDDCVTQLYQASAFNGFPECYLRGLAWDKLIRRLEDLESGRAAWRMLYSPREDWVTIRSPEGETTEGPIKWALEPPAQLGTQGLLEVADQRLADAVDVLFNGVGPAMARNYLNVAAMSHLAAGLRRLREKETPEERAELVITVNRLRALTGQQPSDWEEVVRVELPKPREPYAVSVDGPLFTDPDFFP